MSRSAPYRHFEDKDDLLAAVRLETFRQLFQDLRAEMSDGPMSAPEKLRRGFRVYVRFGLAWPEHYLLMFGERIVEVDKAALAEVAPEGMGFLNTIMTEGQEAGEIRPGDVHDLTILTWSSLHGLVTFGISGLLAAKGLDLEDVLDRLVAELVAGIEA